MTGRYVLYCALFTIVVALLPPPSLAHTTPTRADSFTLTITGPDHDPFLGTLTDTFIAGEKAVYHLEIENQMDTNNTIRLTLSYDAPVLWSVYLGNTHLTGQEHTENYTLSPASSKGIDIGIQAPFNGTEEYTFALQIQAQSTTYSDNEGFSVDITYKPRLLEVTPTSIDATLDIGGTEAIGIHISNTGSSDLEVDCNLEGWGISKGTGSNSTWNIDLQPFPLTVVAGGALDVNLTLYAPKDPEEAKTLTNIVFALHLFPTGDPDVVESVSVSARINEAVEVTLTADSTEKVIGSGGVTEFMITVQNNASATDTATLMPTTLPESWNIEFYVQGEPVQSLKVERGNNTFTARITAPENPLGGRHEINILLTGKSFEGNISVYVIVPTTYGIEINTTSNSEYILDTAINNTLPILIDNKGNAIDRCELSFLRLPEGIELGLNTLNGGGVSLQGVEGDKAVFTIYPGEHVINLNVTLSPDIAPGMYNFTAYVQSKNDPEAGHDSVVIYVRVKKADLEIVGNILTTGKKVKEGDTFSVKITVRNVHLNPVTNVEVSLYIDDSTMPVDTYVIERLDSNRSSQVELRWKASGTGTHLVQIVVHHDGLESDIKEDMTIEVTKKDGGGGFIPYLTIPSVVMALIISLALTYYLASRKHM